MLAWSPALTAGTSWSEFDTIPIVGFVFIFDPFRFKPQSLFLFMYGRDEDRSGEFFESDLNN